MKKTWLWFFFGGCSLVVQASEPSPIIIGIDAEFGHQTSTSAEAIRRGAWIAVDEINAAGGVLGGRPLAIKTLDNRSVPARSVDNIRQFATDPAVVAVLAGKYSPVVQQSAPVAQEYKLPLLVPWAAADDIIDNGFKENFIFRLSLRDRWALEVMLHAASQRGMSRVGLLLPNNGWGRSSRAAATAYVSQHPEIKVTNEAWYNWGDQTLKSQYAQLREAGAQAIVLVANEIEGSILVREMAALPKGQRLPVLSHWGVTGGQFAKLCGPALREVDLSVVQTFSFIGERDSRATQVLQAAQKKFNVRDARAFEAPVGLAHAYDLVHILAQALKKAGNTDRGTVRAALEQLGPYDGLVRRYDPPFTATRHEALGPENVFLARIAADGSIEPLSPSRP